MYGRASRADSRTWSTRTGRAQRRRLISCTRRRSTDKRRESQIKFRHGFHAPTPTPISSLPAPPPSHSLRSICLTRPPRRSPSSSSSSPAPVARPPAAAPPGRGVRHPREVLPHPQGGTPPLLAAAIPRRPAGATTRALPATRGRRRDAEGIPHRGGGLRGGSPPAGAGRTPPQGDAAFLPGAAAARRGGDAGGRRATARAGGRRQGRGRGRGPPGGVSIGMG